jgi:hypothetical protein
VYKSSRFQEITMYWKPLFLTSALFALPLTSACTVPDGTCVPEEEHPCSLVNHCVYEDGESICEAGYQWQDANDADNYVCVPSGDGPGAAGILNWELPQGGHIYGGFGSVAGAGLPSGSATWVTVDLTGDGRPDLVRTGMRSDSGGLRDVVNGYPNENHWVVFKNNGGGFDDTGVRWPVPEGGDVFGGFGATGGRPFDIGANGWALVDLTGDALPDLVVTSVVQDLGGSKKHVAIGYPDNPHWLVYANTGAGFSTQSTRFSLPSGGEPTGGINALAGGQGTAGAGIWSVLDMNDDQRPDLVMSGVYSEGVSQAIGYPADSHWTVYLNNGSGFGERE